MRRYSKGSYKPVWLCIDPSKPCNTEFVRITPNSFSYSEIIDGVYNVGFSLRQEI